MTQGLGHRENSDKGVTIGDALAVIQRLIELTQARGEAIDYTIIVVGGAQRAGRANVFRRRGFVYRPVFG